MRTDIGAIWENFCIVERLKYNQGNKRYGNKYFWRNYEQKEIDYIEEHDGNFEGYEFKWSNETRKYSIICRRNRTEKNISYHPFIEIE